MNNLTRCEMICCDTLFHFKGYLLLLYKKGKWCLILSFNWMQYMNVLAVDFPVLNLTKK